MNELPTDAIEERINSLVVVDSPLLSNLRLRNRNKATAQLDALLVEIERLKAILNYGNKGESVTTLPTNQIEFCIEYVATKFNEKLVATDEAREQLSALVADNERLQKERDKWFFEAERAGQRLWDIRNICSIGIKSHEAFDLALSEQGDN